MQEMDTPKEKLQLLELIQRQDENLKLITDLKDASVCIIEYQNERIEELEQALAEIRQIAHGRHDAISWLQHKDALEHIDAIARAALKGSGVRAVGEQQANTANGMSTAWARCESLSPRT